MIHITREDKIFLLLFLFLTGYLLIRAVQEEFRKKQERNRRLQIGRMGEENTIRQMERIRGHKRILCNLYVPLEDEANTTEIDAVMIHEKGIIVLENKNYSGNIYGNEEESYWIQVQRSGHKKWTKHFYSPVKQNQTHIRRLEKFLKAQPEAWQLPYLSVITFNENAKLKRISVWSEDILVSETRRVRRRLRRKLRWMSRVLTGKQVDLLYEELKVLEHPGKRVERQHEKYVRRGR